MKADLFVLLRAGAPLGNGKNIVRGFFESGRKNGENYIKGSYKFSPPLRDSIHSIARIFVYQYENRWQLLNSTRWYPCRDIINHGGMLNVWQHIYIIDLPDQCPVDGVHRIDLKLPIKREKWDPVMRILIPKYILKGEKYRLDLTFYYRDGTLAGLFVLEFKLFQRSGGSETLYKKVDNIKKVLIREIDDLIEDVNFSSKI